MKASRIDCLSDRGADRTSDRASDRRRLFALRGLACAATALLALGCGSDDEDAAPSSPESEARPPALVDDAMLRAAADDPATWIAHGRTWSEEFIIRSDGCISDLGYPVGSRLEDGRIFTAYYFTKDEGDGNKFGGARHIAGSFFRIAD